MNVYTAGGEYLVVLLGSAAPRTRRVAAAQTSLHLGELPPPHGPGRAAAELSRAAAGADLGIV